MQAEAMQAARAAAQAHALSQLEATAPHAGSLSHNGQASRAKGPRGAFETFTSGPSFGHLHHHDGMPAGGAQGATDGTRTPQELEGLGSLPMARDGPPFPPGGRFMRIPFGVPLSAGLPPPMVLLRGGAPFGAGLGMPTLADLRLGDSPVSKQRSAYVETVEDVSSATDG